MADKYARVAVANYVFAGRGIRKGQCVLLTEAQLKDAQASKPPRLEAIAGPRDGESIVDIRPKSRTPVPEEGTPPARPSLKDQPASQ